MKNLSSILDEVEIGQIHKKVGEDFTLLIYPTNSTYLTNETHVNFSECESVLRSHYNIPDSSIMTFLQIEIETEDSKSLINKVEYQAYDGNKKLLDLSLCNEVNIQVYYAIKDDSIADFDSAMKFKNDGIDIFNLNDSFFNDICEPYSESGDDLILEDRIKDLYQNYSLCEEGCTYDKIDFGNMTIACECKVKNNVSMTFVSVNLEKGEGSSTNFEVVKCYKLVFSLDGKMNNIGFWILGLLTLAHLPILICYLKTGINPIREYILKEMKKYGYIKNNKNANTKNNNSKINKINVRKNENSTKRNNINNNNLIIDSPPKKKKKKKNDKKEDNNKPFVIKNIKIINNNSSFNILKSLKKDILPQINNNQNENKSKGKKTSANKIKKSKGKIGGKRPKILIESKKKKETKKAQTKNISILPTSGEKRIEKKKNLNAFNLINIDLNLNLSKNKKYIPPDSHVILNNYTFEEAVKYDKRQLCVIFYIFALNKQVYFHTFLYRSPLELFSLRLCLMIFITLSDLALNALFYFNENISKKYKKSKNLFLFALSDNIIVIFLSTFVGFILLTFLAKLSNSTNAIREVFLKEEEKMKKDKKYKVTQKVKSEIILEIDKILKNYRLKVFILIIIEFAMMLFFWYFVTAFCHVYKATQTSWLLDSLLSILSRAIIELLICFGLAKLYTMAVIGEIKCLYKILMFLYNLG